MEREVGGGIGMGNTCKPMAVSFQCMTKSTTIIIIIIIIIILKKERKMKKESSGERQREKLCAYQIPEHNEFVSNHQSLKDCLLLSIS